MKRKNLAIIYLFILSIGTILSLYIPKNEVTANDAVIIPNDAIRLRILANSDSGEDQAIKRMVRDEVNKEITQWVSALTSKEEAREVIKAGMPDIQRIAEQVLEEEQVNQSVKVEFGLVDFPTKLYGQFLYPAGQYEAILITLGDGEGANWWCVLFPPLCFLDFSSGVAVSEGFDEEEKIADNDDKKKADNEESSIPEERPSEQKDKPVKSTEQKDSKEQAAAEEKNIEAAVVSNVVVEKEEPSRDNEDHRKQAAETVVTSTQTAETETQSSDEEKSTVATDEKREAAKEMEVEQANSKQTAPVYTSEDEQPVKVKFFVKEIWDSLFG
ncbi:stage II sporulation protein R [Niallia oryzisoli]|uniref:stage II sporulation protein R n=1 Tax=Niallia oryzisoli TaxID=1737571 RepID=UPI0037367EE2